jgi:hypothetical protein
MIPPESEAFYLRNLMVFSAFYFFLTTDFELLFSLNEWMLERRSLFHRVHSSLAVIYIIVSSVFSKCMQNRVGVCAMCKSACTFHDIFPCAHYFKLPSSSNFYTGKTSLRCLY